MDPINWGNILGKVPEIAMAVLVVYFSLKMGKDYRESAAQTMGVWQVWLANQNAAWQQHMNDQQSVFIQTLTDIRSRQSDNTLKLAEELKEISRQVAVVNAMMIEHNASTVAIIAGQKEQTQQRKRPGAQ